MARTKRAADQIKGRDRTALSLEKDTVARDLFGVSSGSTLLNLALTDNPDVGFIVGRFVNIIGDSSSGKSFISLTMFAEAGANPKFNKHRLIYDDAEHAAAFDMNKLFGPDVSKRIESPRYDADGDEVHSNFVEDFQDNLADALEDGRPFIYILDSYDALDALDDLAKSKKQRKARKEDKDEAGTYGMGKAKKSSEIFRRIKGDLKNTESILIVVSQTRADINPKTFTTKTRSGGNALDFYATHLVWTAKAKSFAKKKIPIGVTCRAKVSKNKITGKVREVEFPIFYSYGVDNIRSCILFLVAQEVFKQAKGASKIKAPDMKLEGTMDKLIREIEENDLEEVLFGLVADEWADREASLIVKRKPKFGGK